MFLGPLFYHTNQTLTQPLNANLSPGGQPLSTAGPLGTDEHGFDELGRIMAGGRRRSNRLLRGADLDRHRDAVRRRLRLSGRLVDGVMMRFVDIVYSIPFLFIVLVLATKFSATVLEESLLLGFFSWLVPARLMRGEVLSLRERISCGRRG